MTEKNETAPAQSFSVAGPLQRIGILLLILTGCAGVPDRPAAPLDKQEMVARIAQSRWDALLKGDYEAAYSLMSPASRTLVDLDAFKIRMRRVTWKAATVRKVECSADDLCAVEVKARYAYTLRHGEGVENDHVLTETWRNTEGRWWYVPANPV